MSPPQRYPKDQQNNHHHHPHQQNPPSHNVFPYIQQNAASVPPTPIPLYPTGAAAIVPAPPTYEVIPNRIFVGGFPITTTESDLREHFEKFYAVKDVKMVKSLDGHSKGYGFITFETEDQAEDVRQLPHKQLEFRNRKLNLGPAIRKINAGTFPPGYAIATPSQLVSSPGPFGFAIPATPSPYGGLSFSPAPQMFVYPTIPNQDQNRQPAEQPQQQQQQQSTPQLSPNGQQPQQAFFAGDQEPVRTYASAVSGAEKAQCSPDDQQSVPQHSSPTPQPLVANQNFLNAQYPQPQQQQWNGSEQQQQQPQQYQYPQQQQSADQNNAAGGSGYNNENNNYSQAYAYPQQPYQHFAHHGFLMDSPGGAPVMRPNFGYMTPPHSAGQFPPLMQYPYWHHPNHQQHYQKNAFANNYAGYNNNNFVGPAGDMNYPHQQPQTGFYPQNYNQQQQNPQQQQSHGNDENSFPRALQPPRPGKKSRKPSESHDKKMKTPSKGTRGERNNSSSVSSTPETKSQKNQKTSSPSVPPPLIESLQSLSVSSPIKNQ